jgi:hypothetical protein
MHPLLCPCGAPAAFELLRFQHGRPDGSLGPYCADCSDCYCDGEEREGGIDYARDELPDDEARVQCSVCRSLFEPVNGSNACDACSQEFQD